jgi:hypothetical protein
MNRKAQSACVNSAKGRDAYRNRRACARIFDPQPATGGFPYNRLTVAETDRRHDKPPVYVAGGFGYDG